METFIIILVTFFAGMGAGLGTGFAGMSAAAVIAPMLTVFLGLDFNIAVGIALASDVLASAISAITYGRNKNIDVRNGTVMLACVLVFTVLGSYVSSFMPSTAMGNVSAAVTVFMGIKFLVWPLMTTKEKTLSGSKTKRVAGSAIGGALIGFVCGFVGAGGGMMMLIVLTAVLGYELKTAIGTSVFIMTFTALTGSMSHFIIESAQPDWLILGLCVVFTFIWAQIAAVIANKVKAKTLNRLLGAILVVIGAAIIVFAIIMK